MDRNTVICGDCLDVMRGMDENSIDAIVTDPPYGLSFMGKDWDHGIPGVPFWQEAIRVVKPGAHMLAFGGTRTHHRLMVAIEDAGWEIRDCLMWLYGSGFPKSLDVSKAIDKYRRRDYVLAAIQLGVVPKDLTRSLIDWTRESHTPSDKYWDEFKKVINPEDWGRIEREVIGKSQWTHQAGIPLPTTYTGERCELDITAPATPEAQQWNGWGTALKPAWEPVILARKPLEGTVAENVLKWGTGGINVDGGRIPAPNGLIKGGCSKFGGSFGNSPEHKITNPGGSPLGRWPANLLLDDQAAAVLDEQSGELTSGANPTRRGSAKFKSCYGEFAGQEECIPVRGVDVGKASRFFYTAKADSTERNKHLIGLGKKCNDGRDTPIDNPFQRGETIRKNHHPTVKPVDLLRYLCRLITPPGGVILDPFAGSGSTGIAALEEGFDYILIEIDPEYHQIAKIRNAQKRIGEFA